MDRFELHLQPIKPGNLGFLRELYCVSRDFEMIHYPWSESEKRRFLEWQFELQHQHYQKYYKDGDFNIILWKSKKVGRIYIHRQDHDLRLMDITLMRECRNQGIGTFLIGDLMEEGRRKGARVSLHVEPNNPALRLYQRLGFEIQKTEGAYHLMEWQPDGRQRGDHHQP